MNKKNSINDHKASKSKVSIHDANDAKYDMSHLQIISVDGCLSYVNNEEVRLLFFNNVPSVDNHGKDEETMINRGQTELRMSLSTAKRIISAVAEEILEVEHENKAYYDDKLKTKNNEQYMFG